MSDVSNFADMRVAELRTECEKRGLDKSGNKQVLVDRLQEALSDKDGKPENMETTETDNGNDDELDESGQDGENPIDEAMNDEPETNGATDYIEDQQEEEPQEEEPQEEYIQEGEEEEEPQDNNVQDDSKEEATAGEEKDHLTLDFEEALPDDGDEQGAPAKDEDQSQQDTKTPQKEEDKKKTSSNKTKDAGGDAASKEKTDSAAKEGKSSKDASDKDKRSSKSSKDSKSSHTQNRNLWITNISQSTRATELKQVFSAHGKVIGAKVVINAKYPGACCYGYVTMDTIEDAEKCIKNLNNTELKGQIIKIEKVRPDHMNMATKLSSKHTSSKEHRSKSHTSSKKSDKPKHDKDAKDSKANSGKKVDDGKSESGRSEKKRSRSPRKIDEKDDRTDSRRPQENILTFDKIKEERERQRLAERERELREESRRRREEAARQREVARIQRTEAARLDRERDKLRLEREKLEKEKAEIIRLERERQKLEREKLELEKMELQRAKMRLQTERPERPVVRTADRGPKRSAPYPRDNSFEDRKRTNANERNYDSSRHRFEPPRMKGSEPISSTKYSGQKDYKEYDKRDNYANKRGRDYVPAATSRTPTVITKYDGSAVFDLNRDRDTGDSSRISKNSRYEREREHSPHYRQIRDDRDRRSIPEHKINMRANDHYGDSSSKEGRYDRGSGNWNHPPSSNNSSHGGKVWAKPSWNESNSDRWNSSSGRSGGGQGFGGGSSISLGPACPPPPTINNYVGDRFDYKSLNSMRKY